MKLHNIRLLVEDVVAVTAFYRDVLGLDEQFRSDVYCELSSEGGLSVGVFGRGMMADVVGRAGLPMTPLAGQQDVAVIVFDVSEESVDAVWSRVIAAGAEAVAEPADQTHWGLRVAHLRDPAGHLIEINAPLT